MDAPTTAPLKRGIVRRLRPALPLVRGRKITIHQRKAARRSRYPLIVYTQVSAPWLFEGRHATVDALYDIRVIALNPVEAENLDAIIQNLFSSVTADIELNAVVEGLNVQRCHRVADLPDGGPDRDAEGKRIVELGGTYRIVADTAMS